MIKGLYISESGEVQILGDVNNLTHIISAMEQVIPQLKEQQHKLVADQYSEDELMRMLSEKRKKEPNDTGGKTAKTV